VEVQITGATFSELNERIPDGGKGRPVFDVRLVDRSGQQRQSLSGGGGGGANALRYQYLWEVTGPGPYQLILTWEGRGTLTRTVVVP
jgi:hypothetical protein